MVLTNLITSNPISYMVVSFILVLLQLQVQCQEREKERVHITIHKFQSQGKALNWMLPQISSDIHSLQKKGWWTMIISPVKFKPDGINIKEIILKSTWHTHLKHSKTYACILEKLNNPPYGFCTHLLFASSIFLVFSDLFYIKYPGSSKSI